MTTADLKEMRVLNRVVRIVHDGLLYEPDPRHVDLLAKAFNLEIGISNPRVTPGQKPNQPELEEPDDDDSIESTAASLFNSRSNIAVSLPALRSKRIPRAPMVHSSSMAHPSHWAHRLTPIYLCSRWL